MAKKSTVKTDNKPAETKNQKFIRLANARTSRAIKMVYNIGNLGGAGYESTPEQREKIITTLTEAVESVRVRLNKETSKPTGFQL